MDIHLYIYDIIDDVLQKIQPIGVCVANLCKYDTVQLVAFFSFYQLPWEKNLHL